MLNGCSVRLRGGKTPHRGVAWLVFIHDSIDSPKFVTDPLLASFISSNSTGNETTKCTSAPVFCYKQFTVSLFYLMQVK